MTDLKRSKPGCYVLSGFVPTETLLQHAKGFEEDGSVTGKDLSSELAFYMQETGMMAYAAEALVNFIANEPDHPDRMMAIQIRDQMQSDRQTKPTYRKPEHFASAHDEGLAIAVVIDDRFWTEDW